MFKQIVIQPHHVKLLNSKNSKLLIHTATWMSIWGVKLKEEKTIPKDYIMCDTIYFTFLKWQNYKNENRLVVVKGQG